MQQQKEDSDKKFAMLQAQINAMSMLNSNKVSSGPTRTSNVTTVSVHASMSVPRQHLSSTQVATSTVSQVAYLNPPQPSTSVVTHAPNPISTQPPNSVSPQCPLSVVPSLMQPTGSNLPRPSLTMPSVNQPSFEVENAAAALNAQLSSGLGHSHNMGYEALTINQLRADQNISGNANLMLNNTVQSVPPLNPLSGLVPAAATGSYNSSNVSTVDQLYNATMRSKQLKAFEFAATGQFSYRNQLRRDNTNAITFAYGSFKHLEAAKLGLIQMSDGEFLARLRHLKNTFDIACLSSNLASFSDHS